MSNSENTITFLPGSSWNGFQHFPITFSSVSEMICTRQLFKTLASSLLQSGDYFLSFEDLWCKTFLKFVLLIPTSSSVTDRKPSLNFLKQLCFIKSYLFSKRFMEFLCIFSYELKHFYISLYIFFLVYSKTSNFFHFIKEMLSYFNGCSLQASS